MCRVVVVHAHLNHVARRARPYADPHYYSIFWQAVKSLYPSGQAVYLHSKVPVIASNRDDQKTTSENTFLEADGSQRPPAKIKN
jgi:hypothetical protein